MSSPDLKLGAHVLGYAQRIDAVLAELSVAAEAAHWAAGMLAGDSGFYDGRARADLKAFYDSYAANIDRLSYLDAASAQFLKHVIDTFAGVDQDLAVITADQQPACGEGRR